MTPLDCKCGGKAKTETKRPAIPLVFGPIRYAVVCQACGLYTGFMATEQEALERWNKRPGYVRKKVQKLNEWLSRYRV